jgi:hypothetical protein
MSLRVRLTAVLAALLLGTLSACTTTHTGATEDLVARLRSMNGVVGVGETHEWGDFLLPGSVTFEVRMEPGAAADDIVDVVETAYDEFASTYRRDDADLALRVDDTEILLHTYKPSAVRRDLAELVRFVLAVSGPGESVEADINARDDEDMENLAADVLVQLPEGSAVTDVVPRLDEVAAHGGVPAATDFGVRAADGSGLGGSRGLPNAADRRAWQELSEVESSGTVRVDLRPYQLHSDITSFGLALVAVTTRDHIGKQAATEQFAPVLREHLAAMRRHSDRFVYQVTINGEDRLWFDSTTSCQLTGLPASLAEVLGDFLRTNHRCGF